jgi:hypothetical protein
MVPCERHGCMVVPVYKEDKSLAIRQWLLIQQPPAVGIIGVFDFN